MANRLSSEFSSPPVSPHHRDRGGLVPFCTKYFSRKTQQPEVAGWRSAANSPKPRFPLTIKSPSRVHSRALLNSPPRYPRQSQPLQSVSVPVLPRVPPLLRVPYSPHLTRLALDIGTQGGSAQGARLPIARKGNLEKSERHSHFQTQEGNPLLRVEKSSEGVETLVLPKPVDGRSLEPIETTKRLFSPFERSEMPSTRASQPGSPRSFAEHSAEVLLPTLAAAVQQVFQSSPLLQSEGEVPSRKLSSDQSSSCIGDRDAYGSLREIDIAEEYPQYDTARPSLFIQSPENIEAQASILNPEPESSSNIEPVLGTSRSSGRQKPTTRIPALRAEITQPLPVGLSSNPEPGSQHIDRQIATITPELQKPSLVLPPQEEAKSVGKVSGKGENVRTVAKSAKNSPRAYLKKASPKAAKGKLEEREGHKQAEGRSAEQPTEETKEKRDISGKESEIVGKSSEDEFDNQTNSPKSSKTSFSQAAAESITAPISRKNSHGSESPRSPRSPKFITSPNTALQSSGNTVRIIPEQSDESKRSSSQSSEIDLYDSAFLSTFHPSSQIPKPSPASRKRKMTLPVEVAARMAAEIGKDVSKSSHAQLRRASIAFDHTPQIKSFIAKERRKRKQHIETEESREIKAEGDLGPTRLAGSQLVARQEGPASPRPRVITRPNGKLFIRTRIVDFASVGAADPFDMFLKELAHSLLYMIEDIIDEEIAGQAPPGSEAKQASALMHFLKSSQGNLPMLSLLKQSKQSALVPTSPKGMGAKDYAKKLLQKITTGSKKEAGSDSVSSLSDSEEEFSSEDENDLQKLQRQRDKMADYELKHLSMLKKIAEDLMKGSEATDSIEQMAIPSLPTPVGPEKLWAAWEGLGDVDFSFGSETELGGRVSDLLTGMFAGSSQAEFTAFMASPASGLQHQTTEKEAGFPDTDPDADNYQSDLLRRHFKAICSTLGPEYKAALEEWKASLFQIDPQQLLPIEVMRLLRRAYLKKKHRLQVLKHRTGQFVQLRAKPTTTFSNLHPNRLSELPPGPTACPHTPLQRPKTERPYSERVYLRMKQTSPSSDFFKPSSRPNAAVLSAVSEEV